VAMCAGASVLGQISENPCRESWNLTLEKVDTWRINGVSKENTIGLTVLPLRNATQNAVVTTLHCDSKGRRAYTASWQQLQSSHHLSTHARLQSLGHRDQLDRNLRMEAYQAYMGLGLAAGAAEHTKGASVAR